MMEVPLCELTIKEAVGGLKRKEFSAVELVDSCLERIKKVDGRLQAFLTVDGDDAKAQAQKYDEELARSGEVVFDERPLFGIPIAVKDLFSTKDLRTTAGAKIIENYTPPYNATVVKRLKAAGAIILGKTNEDAWGHGSSGENSDYFPTHNPYDLKRVPGGSSSGSGAAVAAGECLAATGTDTGSSVRLPASFCNLVGLKPTYGRVSRYGIIAMASSFDSIGHLTRTVYDNALILAVTAGKDDLDATTTAVKVPPYNRNLGGSIKGWRIGVPREYFIEGIGKEVEERTQEAVGVFQRLGAEIKEISLPYTKYAMASYYILVPAEISSNLARFDGIRFGRGRETFGAEAKRRIMLGTYALSAGYYDAYYQKAAQVRTLIKHDFEEVFAEVDIVLAPTSPTPPFKLGEKADNPLQMYLSDIFLCPVNLAGIPSLNVPAGFVGDLPVGVQLMGPHFSEERLYQAAYAFEQETRYYEKRPKLF